MSSPDFVKTLKKSSFGHFPAGREARGNRQARRGGIAKRGSSMLFTRALAAAAVVFSAGAAQAEDSAVVLGKSTYNARCALCHGADGKGGGEIAELFAVRPSDLSTLAERADGKFPFSTVYDIIVNGMEQRGHGDSTMPIWGDYFMADALMDRGVSQSDALYMASGRILSVVYYLESIQQ